MPRHYDNETKTEAEREMILSDMREEKLARLEEQPKPVVAKPIPEHDPVNHPVHYTSHPSGVECIAITEHMGFNLGNALKYIWRADLKNDVEDLEKALWYVAREIEKRKRITAL